VTSIQQTLTVGHALEIARLQVPDQEREGKRCQRGTKASGTFLSSPFFSSPEKVPDTFFSPCYSHRLNAHHILPRYTSEFRPWCCARRLVNGTTGQDQSGVRPPNGSLRESPHRQGLLHQIDLPAAVPYRFACGRQSSFPSSSGRRARFYQRKFSTGMVLLLFWPI
jgi:hypothetical protein